MLLGALAFHGWAAEAFALEPEGREGEASSSVQDEAPLKIPGEWPRLQPGRAEPLAEFFEALTPASLDDLKVFEAHLKELVPRASAAVVGVRVGGAGGSGVVISEDGLVLTAAHVARVPGREVHFLFPNGTTARGETLGTDHEMDAGLMRISDAGPWPHAQPGEAGVLRVGDWVLAMGHPGGFDPERSLVVRLGRIIRLRPDALQTDCTLSGGDSGGPLLDMHGRVIGIHSRISESTTENYHVPIGTYYETWERLVKGENWGDEPPLPRSWVGVRGADDPDRCRIESVEANSPASKAGLQPGDIIQKVNGREIQDFAAFRALVAMTRPGEELTLMIERDGTAMSLTVRPEARDGSR
jgi:serine protease Do